MHALLGLPLSQPLFRSWQALLPRTAIGAEGAQRSALAGIAAEPKAQGAGKGQRLSDVHLSLPSLAGADPAHVHTIWGSYDYHHYMQASLGCIACALFRLQLPACTRQVWCHMMGPVQSKLLLCPCKCLYIVSSMASIAVALLPWERELRDIMLNPVPVCGAR